MRSYSTMKGVSLIELLVGVAILLAGIITIINIFPVSLRANNDAAMLSKASFLAQQKAEEIRRDSDSAKTLINNIRVLSAPTPPVQFPQEPMLAYRFSGVSLFDTIDDPEDPRDDTGVARIIVQYDRSYRKDERVIYELRFDE